MTQDEYAQGFLVDIAQGGFIMVILLACILIGTLIVSIITEQKELKSRSAKGEANE